MIYIILACSTDPAETRYEVEQLEARQIALQESVQGLESKKVALTRDLTALHQQVSLLEAQASGKKIRYILHVELRQTHFSLDIMKHAKDAMNAVEFDVSTDKDTYESTRDGDTLLKQFRSGSFWTESSVGDWQITVKSHRTEVI